MRQVTSGVTFVLTGGNKVVTWSGEMGIDVDVVSVRNNDGNRCHYHYAELVTGGMDLRAPSGKSVTQVTFCADGESNPGAPPPEPDNIVTTVGDLCQASFKEEGTGTDLISDPSVSFGFTAASPDQQEQVAVCAAGDQQECLPNPPRKDYDKNLCGTTAGLYPGELPISCLPVDLNTPAGSPKYCWYYENQVCDAHARSENLFGCNDPLKRTPVVDTFRPKTEVGGIDFSVTVFDGSTTYTTCTRSRCWTSTQ